MLKVMRYFEYENAAKFRAEWAALSDRDKADLKKGVEDGTLTY